MSRPHYSMPLRIVNGRFATVEEDSAADVAQSVGLLIATEPGERLSVPEYGVPSSLFETSVESAQIRSQVSRWEPRAGTVNIDTLQDGESITVTINAQGGDS